MFGVIVSDHVMVAHSFRGEVFGEAQRLHGATYVVEAGFQGEALDGDGLLVDIGAASALLHEVLAGLAYRNLDELPEFAGTNTTTEVVAGHVADRLVERVRAGSLGGTGQVQLIRVTLQESPTARAWCERVP